MIYVPESRLSERLWDTILQASTTAESIINLIRYNEKNCLLIYGPAAWWWNGGGGGGGEAGYQ